MLQWAIELWCSRFPEKVDIPMAGKLTQDKRIAELTTPLGKDVLVISSFNGTEGLGELFEYTLEVLSEDKNIDFDKAIGQACTVKLFAYQGKKRFFNGILTVARWAEMQDDYAKYHLVLRPWFYLLGYKADCRIFLDKNVKDIIQEVFTKAGFNDFKFSTTADYDTIPYCVQYRETDLAFCSRLMEEYGIYYFYEHSDGKHTMVLADSKTSHKPNPDVPKLPYLPLSNDELMLDQHLGDWISERRFRTGKVEFNDYDYLKPTKKLRESHEATEKYAHAKLEVYDYPGKYDEEEKGKKFAQFRLEAEQSFDHRRYVTGDAASLFPGSLVTVERHPLDSENTDFLVVHASHRFSVQTFRSGSGGGEQQAYQGDYEFLPKKQPFRSLPVTPKPRIYGIQTAKVVGKKGEESEEISTDENAHIWVQFFWDREPKKSCPVRVAHAWSGKKWGTQFIPRIGMEVVVDFLEGDPDRPLVTGCVYNGDNKVPYDLPSKKTQSGTKSDSSKGHNGYNEFMFEDKKGDELIRMHAQKDHLVQINANQTGYVGAVELDSPYQGGNQTWTVGNDRNWTIQKGDDNLKIQMGSQNILIEMGDQNIKLELGTQNVETMLGINLSVCFGLSTINITPGSISLQSPMINLTGDAMINLNAPLIMMPGGAVMIMPGPLVGMGVVIPPV
jgi:type VI secretion system secreted protein VgrG